MEAADWILLGAAVAVAAALAWAAVVYWRLYWYGEFSCPACGRRFRPALGKLVFSLNVPGGKVLRCPCCGEKNYMEPHYRKERRDRKEKEG